MKTKTINPVIDKGFKKELEQLTIQIQQLSDELEAMGNELKNCTAEESNKLIINYLSKSNELLSAANKRKELVRDQLDKITKEMYNTVHQQ